MTALLLLAMVLGLGLVALAWGITRDRRCRSKSMSKDLIRPRVNGT